MECFRCFTLTFEGGIIIMSDYFEFCELQSCQAIGRQQDIGFIKLNRGF